MIRSGPITAPNHCRCLSRMLTAEYQRLKAPTSEDGGGPVKNAHLLHRGIPPIAHLGIPVHKPADCCGAL